MMNTVCVCEDYQSTLRLATDILSHEGLEVAGFQRADQAREYLNEHAADVRMLFADVRMPGELDGLELARIAAEAWPWIMIVVTSGSEYDADSGLPEGAKFLLKPWHVADLVTLAQAAEG